MTAGESPPERVPGPPHGRSRRSPGLVAAGDPVAALRQAEVGHVPVLRGLVRLAVDVGWLGAGLVADGRVPVRGKLAAVAGVGAALHGARVGGGPRALSSLAGFLGVRALLRSAGYAVVYERWRGSDEGLAILFALAGVREDRVTGPPGGGGEAGTADGDERRASK